ncbi:MAG: nucleotidyltransferase [Bacteroidetes bacterium]|nr:MAG: nucleotidyltransferase [Bacteroidota bacterium]
MSQTQDIRWQQRFNNFEKAYMLLKEAVEKKDLTELEKNGLVQRFEFTIELCWNLLKDYLDEGGARFKPIPKETIREAAKAGIVYEPQVLIDALTLRNELSHDYSGKLSEKAEQQIRDDIFPALGNVHTYFKELSAQKQ